MTEYIDKSCAHIKCLTMKGACGVVAIGVLPLVTRVTPKPLILSDVTRPRFSSTSTYLNGLYQNMYSYEVGSVGRFNLNLFTSLDPNQLREVFPHFLKFAYSEGFDIGVENKHLTVDNVDQFTFTNCALLANFGLWVRDCLHSHVPDAKLFGALTKVGAELEWALTRVRVEPLVSTPEVEQPPQVEPLPAPADPPVDQGTLRPRVPIHGRRRHRERFCRPRVVRNENLPDTPRRRPRKRTI